MSFLRTSVSVIATQMLVAPVALLTGVVLARALPVDDRGIYAAATELVGILVIAIELGWAPTAIYRLRRAGIPPARVAGAALWVTGMVTLIAWAACFALEDGLRSRFLAGADPIVLALAVAAIPFELAGLTFTGVARGLGRFDLHNAYRLGAAVLLLAGVGTALVFERHAATALAGMLAARALAGSALIAAVLRESGLELRFPRTEIRQSLTFGFQSHLQQILVALHQRLDVLLIAWLSGDPASVAIYAVAVGVINRVRLLPMSIALAMFPTITGQDAAVASRFTARVSRISIALVVGTALLLAPVAPVVVPLLFGREYGPSVAPLLVLLPASVFLTPGLILARYFTSRAKQPRCIAIMLVSTALNVALNLLWIPGHGATGAAAASVVSYGLQFVLMLFVFSLESGTGVVEATVLTREDLHTFGARLSAWWRRRGGAPGKPG